jgi:hypothetical protein
MMDEKEYLETRVDDQINWYGQKATKFKILNIWSRGIIIVFSAIIPFISVFKPITTLATISLCSRLVDILIPLLGSLTSIAAGFSALLKFQENWIEYRTTSENLKHEKYLYLNQSGPYESSKDSYKIFVNRIESLISKENSTWSAMFSAPEKT